MIWSSIGLVSEPCFVRIMAQLVLHRVAWTPLSTLLLIEMHRCEWLLRLIAPIAFILQMATLVSLITVWFGLMVKCGIGILVSLYLWAMTDRNRPVTLRICGGLLLGAQVTFTLLLRPSLLTWRLLAIRLVIRFVTWRVVILKFVVLKTRELTRSRRLTRPRRGLLVIVPVVEVVILLVSVRLNPRLLRVAVTNLRARVLILIAIWISIPGWMLARLVSWDSWLTLLKELVMTWSILVLSVCCNLRLSPPPLRKSRWLLDIFVCRVILNLFTAYILTCNFLLLV